ncbi:MAG: flagellar protein FliS [Candidatus Acidiferrum sp.]
MNRQDSTSAYHQATAFGASALGQVVALYDTILHDLRRALAALDAGQIEPRVNATNHALIVIGELQSVLDFGRGGDAARNLNNFYNVSRALATEASVVGTRVRFVELISMFARLRAAWSYVEHSVAPSEPPDRPRMLPKSQSTFSQSAPIASETSESVGSGSWKA